MRLIDSDHAERWKLARGVGEKRSIAAAKVDECRELLSLQIVDDRREVPFDAEGTATLRVEIQIAIDVFAVTVALLLARQRDNVCGQRDVRVVDHRRAP